MTSELSDADVTREVDADCYFSKQSMTPAVCDGNDDDDGSTREVVAAAASSGGDSYINGNGASTPNDDTTAAVGPDFSNTADSSGFAQNGTDSGRWGAEDCPPTTDDDGGSAPVIDDEGYRVEHRFETESVSRSKEVRDLEDESTELRMRETKEVTLEELKTRDGETRPATAEEIRALLEAQWDGCDEVEISREVVVEEFNRVESQHEEVVGGKVVANTVSVTEERKTEEVHETPQSAKGTLTLTEAPEDAQPPAVTGVEDLPTVEVAVASATVAAPTPARTNDEVPAASPSPASPETPMTTPPKSADTGKKDKHKRFSLFGKKKKSSSEAEDLKNVSNKHADVDLRQKGNSLGRKTKSPKSDDVFEGETSGKRTSGGPFSFLSLKRNKAKPCSKVPSSESAPALDLGDDCHAERIVYELEVEGNVVAKVRPPSSTSDKGSNGRQCGTGTTVAVVDETSPTVERPLVHDRHLVVVAIDFGTTFSGYAFSFVPDSESVSSDRPIHMMRRWEGGDPGVINQKTLTALLLTPEGQFQAFGFTARNFYHDLEPSDAQRWMYFDKFKMALHSNPELSRSTEVVATNGAKMPAVVVLSHALRHFSQLAVREIGEQCATALSTDDVLWVVTVPAIWTAGAKQLMRQAAYDAGIASAQSPEQLVIALEPEAASIYIRRLRMSQLVPQHPVGRRTLLSTSGSGAVPDHVTGNETDAGNSQQMSESFVPGVRYMVVDCGGGTVDITVHEMDSQTGKLNELYKATGGPHGSTGIDREFERLLENIFGAEFIAMFKLRRPAGWVDLMIAFESRKRAADPNKQQPLNVSLPFSLIDFHKKQFGNQVESAIKKYGDKDVLWSAQGMLRLMPAAMQRLYRPTVDSINQAISRIFDDKNMEGIELLFLVGGFAESAMLQTEIRQHFGQRVKIAIPQDASLAILKGAVCFGLDPTTVSVRRSRQTYGVGVVRRFVRGRHPESRLVCRDGIDWCTGILDRFVGSGDAVFVGSTVTRRYAPAARDQSSSVIHVYCSESADIQFVDDRGVTRCGTLRLDVADLPPPPSPVSPPSTRSAGVREIQAKMTFGGTEIKVSAVDVASGQCVRCTIDFLSQ